MDYPPDNLMQQYHRVVAKAGTNGDNTGNNYGVVNGSLDGAGDKVGPSTDDFEEDNCSSSVGTKVWAENLEEDVDNIYWSNDHNWFGIEHAYTVSNIPMYDYVVTRMKDLIDYDQPI